jgi:glycosyltransferase involved in cell wall biosynthesis
MRHRGQAVCAQGGFGNQMQAFSPSLAHDTIETSSYVTWVQSKRILFVVGDAPFFVTHFWELARAVLAGGTKIHVATPQDNGSGRGDEEAIRKIESLGVQVHRIGLQRAGVNPFSELALIHELNNLIGALCPDLVHCLGVKPILYVGAITRLKGIPTVHSVIGLGLPFMRRGAVAALRRQAILAGFKFAFSNPKASITVEHELDHATIAGVVGDRHVVRTFGVGVDLSLFHPRSEGKRTSEPVIMFAARLIETKGVRHFVEAARRVKARGVAARFVLQCQLDLRNRHAIHPDEVKTWADEGVIEWWGQTTEMATALRKADIFCLPTFYREGTPKALLEAAASGLPIVTTAIPGCKDVVEHNESGLLIPPQNVDALEQALLTLIEDDSFRLSASARAREIAMQKFGVRAYINSVTKLYQTALSPLSASRARVAQT